MKTTSSNNMDSNGKKKNLKNCIGGCASGALSARGAHDRLSAHDEHGAPERHPVPRSNSQC